MTIVLAAIDNSAAARPVLETALHLARHVHAEARAVHVREDGSETALDVAASMGVPLRVLDGEPADLIESALADPGVVLGVLGSRATPVGSRPAGHLALAIATACAKPLVVVAPDCRSYGPLDGGRVLVPLDGTQDSADSVQAASALFADAEVAVVGLHVFDPSTFPRFWDQAHHAAEAWRSEFTARYLPAEAARLELRTGSPGSRVVDVAEEEQVDLIALCWSQTLAEGRAQTVREVLDRARVPVLLLPRLEGKREERRPGTVTVARGDPVAKPA
jgi:nucleotide-binding universal stress UspA family protein